MWRTGIVGVAVVLIGASVSWCCGGYGEEAFDREECIQMLRRQGPAGLEVALANYAAFESKMKKSPPAQLQRYREVVDRVAGQRHATISRLYWHTDLAAAKAAATQSGKPILSLSMLGQLTDEFSCANSRFFRTSLYANAAISQRMREKFVLHWQSVRPVPKVTIDFGDGRKLKRTVTGNSAHYLLDATGRPLDVLPGLYSPQKFLTWLASAERLFESYRQPPEKMSPEQNLAA